MGGRRFAIRGVAPPGSDVFQGKKGDFFNLVFRAGLGGDTRRSRMQPCIMKGSYWFGLLSELCFPLFLLQGEFA